MLIEVKVPVFSESITEGTLINWLKKQGEHVERGENLIDIETDKVVLELPAPQSGVLTEIVKNDGTVVTSGEIIARIDTTAKGSKTPPKPHKLLPDPLPLNSRKLTRRMDHPDHHGRIARLCQPPKKRQMKTG